MTQIKSAKAECLLNAAKQSNVNGCPVSLDVATQSVIIAETEAEERHAKELQELKDKAVEAFCSRGQCFNTCPSRQCKALDSFTQKLNEQ